MTFERSLKMDTGKFPHGCILPEPMELYLFTVFTCFLNDPLPARKSLSCPSLSLQSLALGWLNRYTSKDQRHWIQYLILLTILSPHLIPCPIQKAAQIYHTLDFDLPIEYLVALYTTQKIQLLVGFGFPKTISACSRSFSKLPVPSSTSYSLSCYA